MASINRTRVLGGSSSQIAPFHPKPKHPPITTTARMVSARGGIRLHIGCGKRKLAGWVNADIAPGLGDIEFDLQRDELPAHAYREIYGSHVLEHCWAEETPKILSKLLNALLPGGTLRLSVPDLRLVLKNCVDSHAYGDSGSAQRVVFGGDAGRGVSEPDRHKQVFWREHLERLLMEAGFVNVRDWGKGQYPAIDALKDYATWPHDAQGHSLISLNMEADKPGLLEATAARTVGGSPIVVSVLLGTVNRPTLLRDCIDAVRASIVDMPYEIIVAYGAETDESLPWLREQADVVPILGGMGGAIEAFNRAYAMSRGALICQLNDDVIVDGDSITKAINHLNTHGDVAGVAFKFDRNDGRGYHHEKIANYLHPNQMVVRRETCEAVIERIGAFWGDAAHRTDRTYGGDTAFGILCHHLGLTLVSVEGVTCRDLLAQDDLRTHNKAPDDHLKNFRAMYAFQMQTQDDAPAADAWPHCYVPRAGTAPRRSPIEAGQPLRVLALPIAIKDWPQTALRSALAKIGPYAEILTTTGKPPGGLNLVEAHKPDLIWAQIQGEGWEEYARLLRRAAGPNCVMVQWNGDVRTDANMDVLPWIPRLAPTFDILLADNCTYPKKLAQRGIVAGYLSHGFESEIVWESEAEESAYAVFIGTNYPQLDGGARLDLFKQVEHESPGHLLIYGDGWTRSGLAFQGPVEISEAGRIMRRAPVTICKSLFTNLERYTSNRLKYAFASGAVAAIERFADMEGLGLVPDVNCLVWSSAKELAKLIHDWTQPSYADARADMRKRARALAVERFTWDRSVEELLAIVRDYRARRGIG
jgi:predicted SAM-dependent methyltransferase